MQSSYFGATWFIPCSIMQANSARYALKMIKRVAYAPNMLAELSSRKKSLSTQIFSSIITENGRFTEFRDVNLIKYALGFNFIGSYVHDKRGEGLQLSFYTPDRVDSAYSFSPLSAAVFTQTVLDVCGIEEEIEIAYYSLMKKGILQSGCFNITKEYLEHFPVEQLQPAANPDADEHYYVLNLREPHVSLPQSLAFSSLSAEVNTKHLRNHINCKEKKELADTVINHAELYKLNKISYFDYNVMNRVTN
ncbi:hypothetical protein SJI19_16625 [Acerihabitans sp. TG2]|uniref:hypothetical protein n=1 Tax=Acerihabitans sp. TG2 TaxID=3096008 RepID=UPI002B23AD82|nr:hypothetical protein [Acerihabitans sp. TG2]MEA9392150.1 hypothetical protein [Acerihabitans sp. TG2]